MQLNNIKCIQEEMGQCPYQLRTSCLFHSAQVVHHIRLETAAANIPRSPLWCERLQEDAALRAGGPHRFQACDGIEEVTPAYLLKNREKTIQQGQLNGEALFRNDQNPTVLFIVSDLEGFFFSNQILFSILFYMHNNIFTDVGMITVAFPDISLGVTCPEKAPGFMQYGCLFYRRQDGLGQLKGHIMDMRAVRDCYCIFCNLLYLEALSSFSRDCICIESSEIREGKTFDHFLAKKIIEGQINIKKLLKSVWSTVGTGITGTSMSGRAVKDYVNAIQENVELSSKQQSLEQAAYELYLLPRPWAVGEWIFPTDSGDKIPFKATVSWWNRLGWRHSVDGVELKWSS
ncbi:hypothetical protein EK904_013971 [Melospiza melodia maxima]|nr:hypothetical protein EK904_013971 [Melospiza melodia maxima]